MVNIVYRDSDSEPGENVNRQAPHPSGRVVSVRLTADIEKRLNELAERTGRSRGFYLRLALEAMLPELERGHWAHAAREYESDLLMDRFREITSGLMSAREPAEGDLGEGAEGPGA